VDRWETVCIAIPNKTGATVGDLAVPFNPTSNNPYPGGNAIYLMASATRKRYDDRLR